jgi:hypothetical protein
VLNNACGLKRLRATVETLVPAHTQHLGQKLLREGKRITLGEVASPEKPAGKTLLDGVRGVAGRRLLRLRIDNLFMADQKRLQRGALLGRPF